MSDEHEQVRRQLAVVSQNALARTRLVTRGGELANHLSASAEYTSRSNSRFVEVTLPPPQSDLINNVDTAGVVWPLPYATWDEVWVWDAEPFPEQRDTWIMEWMSHQPDQRVVAGETIAIMFGGPDPSFDTQVNIPAPVDGTLIQLVPDGIACSVIGVVETCSPLPQLRPEPSLGGRSPDEDEMKELLARFKGDGHL